MRNTPEFGLQMGDDNDGIPVAAPRGHRRRLGKLPRVMLSGATVDVTTQRTAKKWCGKSLSLGVLHDQVYAFAVRRGFKPNRKRK